MEDRVPGPGEGKCCPVLTPDTGHCRSANLRGNFVSGATQQAHLRPTTISEGQFPRPARGRDGKTPATLQNAHACVSQAAGLGAEEGPSGAASPLGSGSAGIQSKPPVQPGLLMERKRSDAQTEGRECWISPFRYGQGKEGRWPAHPAGASGGRWCWAAKSSTTGEGRGGRPAPTRSLPLHRQHQRVMARHSHHGEGHMWVSAGGTGRE